MNHEERAETDLRALQLACLRILKKFAEVCDRNHLKYYLAYGTLLGAIRHHGYIPWDDDIDVWMPRPDMEKLLEIADEELRPYVVNFYTIRNEAYFRYRSQPCVEDQSFQVGFSLGGAIKPGYIWIDIMPLDGMPSGRLRQKIQCRKFSLMYALIGLARSARIGAFNRERKTGLKKLVIRFNEAFKIGCLLDVEALLNRFESIRKRYSFSESEYVVGTTTSYTEKAIFRKSWFDGERKAEFEGEQFSIPMESEKILASLYGDYMKLPPEEKRVRSHFTVIPENGGEAIL